MHRGRQDDFLECHVNAMCVCFDHLFRALSIDILKGNHVLTQVNSDAVCYLVPPLAFFVIRTGFGNACRSVV